MRPRMKIKRRYRKPASNFILIKIRTIRTLRRNFKELGEATTC